jgi:hypothetical protein
VSSEGSWRKKAISLSIPEDILIGLDALVNKEIVSHLRKNPQIGSMTQWLFQTPEGRKANHDLVRNMSSGMNQALANRILRSTYEEELRATNQESGHHIRNMDGSYKVESFRNDLIVKILQDYLEKDYNGKKTKS